MTDERPIPYPGLRPFGTEDAEWFFGREPQVDELLRRLRKRRFLAVVGASGLGKSSLVMAGLIPALYAGRLRGSRAEWRTATMRPGGTPTRALADALASMTPARDDENRAEQVDLLESILARSSQGLADAVTQRGAPDTSYLLVVDQFEELFRFRAALQSQRAWTDEAVAFVRLLLAATDPARTPLPLHVVITMRADFLGACSEFRDLPEAISAGQFLIPRLTRDQIEQVIRRPAAMEGGKLDRALVQRLLMDVGDDPSKLPVLQHALMRLWMCRRDGADLDRPIGLEDYEKIGRLDGALDQHGEEILDELAPSGDQALVEPVLKALSELGRDGRNLRRPRRLQDLAAVAGCTTTRLVPVLDVFRARSCTFLSPPLEQPLREETVVDLTHEALITGWTRLRRWAADDHEDGITYRRLAEQAERHQRGADLWANLDLQEGLAWRERVKPTAVWAARYHESVALPLALDFLEESRRQARWRRVKRYLKLGASALLLAAAAWIPVWVNDHYKLTEANRQADHALQMARDAEQTAGVLVREAEEKQSAAIRQVRDAEGISAELRKSNLAQQDQLIARKSELALARQKVKAAKQQHEKTAKELVTMKNELKEERAEAATREILAPPDTIRW